LSSTATFDPLVPPAPKSASGALQIAAATVGNAMEWFDILIYGYFAPTIASVFFPNSNPMVSLLLTFGSFGLSYVARPVGAVVLGAYADRAGRRAALALSIRLMVIGTAVLALMPSYAAIGLIAPVAVFSARLLQGFAVAGEFGSSTAFMIEHSAHRKGFFASWQFAGQNMAKFLAALFGVGVTTALSAQHLHAWGWRIPFIFGLLVGPVGMYIRRKVDETPEFLHTTHTRTPVREVFVHEKRGVLIGAALVAVGTASTYFSIYLPTFATTRLHLLPDWWAAGRPIWLHARDASHGNPDAAVLLSDFSPDHAPPWDDDPICRTYLGVDPAGRLCVIFTGRDGEDLSRTHPGHGTLAQLQPGSDSLWWFCTGYLYLAHRGNPQQHCTQLLSHGDGGDQYHCGGAGDSILW
jgi:MFS family permease